MAKHLSSRGLANRLSLTGGGWICRTPGWRSRRVAGAGPRAFQTPVFWARMQFIRKQ
jgi:hypothetical protein